MDAILHAKHMHLLFARMPALPMHCISTASSRLPRMRSWQQILTQGCRSTLLGAAGFAFLITTQEQAFWI